MKLSELLNIKWNYQMTEQLMALLEDRTTREQAFNRYLATKPDLSKDCFLDEFQNNHSDRNILKQDFTPPQLSLLMARLSGHADTVLDVCAGTGSLTIAKWNQTPNAKFYCQEYDRQALAILLFNLAIRNMNAEIQHCDVLTGEVFASYKLTPQVQFSDIQKVALDWSTLKVDCVISNPPYSATWQPREDERFTPYGLAPKSKADYAFILHGLYFLKITGKSFFILPHGVLFRGQKEGDIRKKLLEKHYIQTIIGLPEKLFLNTTIPTCIINICKQGCSDTLFIDASQKFKKGKNQNFLLDEHIQAIISAHEKRHHVDKFAYVATANEIEEQEYNLNIPRYVDTFEPEPLPNIVAVIDEMLTIDKEIRATEQSLLSNFKQLCAQTPSKQEELNTFVRKFEEYCQHGRVNKEATIAIRERAAKGKATPADVHTVVGLIEKQEKIIETTKQMKFYFMNEMFV